MNKEKYNYKEYVKNLTLIGKRIEDAVKSQNDIKKNQWYYYLQGYIKGAEVILED